MSPSGIKLYSYEVTLRYLGRHVLTGNYKDKEGTKGKRGQPL